MDDVQIDGVVSRAWWAGTVAALLRQSDAEILGQLAARAMRTHRVNEAEQLRAWAWTLDVLRVALCGLPAEFRVLLEYPLVRLGRRLDVLLVTSSAVFVLEFKAFAAGFSKAAREQAEDYALDLRDFHAASRHALLVPIVVAGTGTPVRPQWRLPLPGLTEVYEALPGQLADLINAVLARADRHDVDVAGWDSAPYRPVPTIVEAARDIYQRHGVENIRAARADTDNLGRTIAAILQAVQDAKTGRYIALFVTGIPGAGKTLCGLDAVFSATTGATFLTGTLPMVYVLRAALAMDRKDGSLRRAQHSIKQPIQSITGFLREYGGSAVAPPEHMIVFDEAQRAWDAAYGARKFGLPASEAAIVLDIMRRHQDFAVVVGLIGHGQEINTGEAGLAAWGAALAARPEWEVRASPVVLDPGRAPRQRLFAVKPDTMVLDNSLHLAVPIRNYASSRAQDWVSAVLQGDVDAARACGDDMPFYVTRSLAQMRAALRARARGRRRAGLVCSSGAKRLVADGVWPRFEHMDERVVANWFLKSWPEDVRASDALEIPATEFACQGLELDYVGLCWGGDLTWRAGWQVRNFKGTDWQNRAGQDARDYRINTYRVLLTRARADTLIWVPQGDKADRTREPERFDRTAEFFVACGARVLGEIAEVGLAETTLI
jgi:hypothetical protein